MIFSLFFSFPELLKSFVVLAMQYMCVRATDWTDVNSCQYVTICMGWKGPHSAV